jgi:hypothetical protein
MFRFTIRDVLWATAESPQDEEDDGLHIGSPGAMLVNLTGLMCLALVIAKWVGCS